MALSLTISDLADGTGATATIAGSDAATVTLYTQDPPETGTSWTSRGTRSGNGSLTLSLSPGLYWAYAAGTVSGSPAVSNIVWFAATDGESIQHRVLNAVVAAIQAMASGGSLGELPASQVYKRKALDDTPLGFPAVVVTPNDREQLRGATNQRSDWGRPAVVHIVDRSSQEMAFENDRHDYLLWRERLMRRFNHKRLDGVEDVSYCEVEPALILDPKLPAYQYLVSAFTVRAYTRESRSV